MLRHLQPLKADLEVNAPQSAVIPPPPRMPAPEQDEFEVVFDGRQSLIGDRESRQQ